jgi:hypothetical protein
VQATKYRSPNFFLDDLDLEESGNCMMWNMINFVATEMDPTVARLAKENPDVLLIFNLSGIVPTNIHVGKTLDSVREIWW